MARPPWAAAPDRRSCQGAALRSARPALRPAALRVHKGTVRARATALQVQSAHPLHFSTTPDGAEPNLPEEEETSRDNCDSYTEMQQCIKNEIIDSRLRFKNSLFQKS